MLAEYREKPLKIVGQFRTEFDPLTGGRVVDGETKGVQGLTIQDDRLVQRSSA